MRFPKVVTLACGFAVALLPAVSAPAQNLPSECRQAMAVRSPQAQITLFTACLRHTSLAETDRAKVLKQRAVAYMHLGQQRRALGDMNEAIRLNSEDADSYYVRGMVYRALGDNARAIADSNQAIGMEPNFAAAYANRAFAYQAQGDTSQAKSDARHARELDPQVKVPQF